MLEASVISNERRFKESLRGYKGRLGPGSGVGGSVYIRWTDVEKSPLNTKI